VDGKSLRNAAGKGATVLRESDPPRLGFPRACRLVRRAEYDAVYREGRRRTSREFTIFLRPNGLDNSRFGWSIKKALGNAVRRNRIRRRLREILRLHRQEISPGWDIVIHPRTSAATAKFSALAEELVKLLPRPEAKAETRTP
jgi:ribonuclease P protein component